MTLTIGSLFSGIGGLELGLEWAGLGPTLWQVERDPYCRAVLAKHWPDATRYEDVRHVGQANLAPVDVICGGYPCQPFSIAGERRGAHDERHLWPEFARILGELRPRYAVLENVAAHLSLGFGDVLGDLSDLGYDAEWSVVSACAVGASHMRERLFVLAYPAHVGRQGAVHGARHGASGGASPFGLSASGNGARQSGAPARWQTRPPEFLRGSNGLPHRVHRVHALGNAVVPQVAEVVGRMILALEAERQGQELAA
ncbi:MAG: DNA cytosine methyltransferase [Gemmatimonadaceae bacterium]